MEKSKQEQASNLWKVSISKKGDPSINLELSVLAETSAKAKSEARVKYEMTKIGLTSRNSKISVAKICPIEKT